MSGEGKGKLFDSSKNLHYIWSAKGKGIKEGVGGETCDRN